ncbi:MAG: PDZ domain-containing protein [Opitutaceae bacterium]
MKSIIRYIVPLTGLAAAMPAVRAEDAGPPPPADKEMRVIAGPDDHAPQPPSSPHRERRVMAFHVPREMESVTFLGIASSPAGAALADQLDLPKDTGLVVNIIMPGSPADNVLKPYDVLVKLDDQLLIEQHQLSVLIRNHKEGDEITLTYIRGGKEATAKVKLTKHDMPKMALQDGGAHAEAFARAMSDADANPGAGREDIDRMHSLTDHDEAFGPGQVSVARRGGHNGGVRIRTVSVNASNSNMVFSDAQGSLDLTIMDGNQTLVAKDAKGVQLFSGPVTTAEERQAMPADVRARLDKLEAMQDFRFKTDGDFHSGETKDVPPQH